MLSNACRNDGVNCDGYTDDAVTECECTCHRTWGAPFLTNEEVVDYHVSSAIFRPAIDSDDVAAVLKSGGDVICTYDGRVFVTRFRYLP